MGWDKVDAASDDVTAEQREAAEEAAYNDEVRTVLSEQLRRVSQAVEAVISANTGGGHDFYVASNAWVAEVHRLDELMRRRGLISFEARL